MAADLEGWLAPNRIYPGVPEAMRALMQRHEVYIVTTKQVGAGGRGAGRAAPRALQWRSRGVAVARPCSPTALLCPPARVASRPAPTCPGAVH